MSISGRIRRSDRIAASLQRADMSAPTYPCVKPASSDRSTSFARGMPLVWIWRISSRPAQGRVEGVRPVRRADDHDLPAGLQSVHERKELRDHPSLDLAGDLVPLRCDAVQFVDEDDARGVFLGLLEDVSEVLLALSVEFGHDLGARDRMEVRVRLRGDGLREQGLPGPRRTVEEDAFWRLDAEPLKQLRMAQREFDHLADLPDLGAEPADVLLVDLRDLRPFLF